MQLFLYNTLSRDKEIFCPIDVNLIKMYVCGPTVYDSPHLGNARSVVVYDILYRILSKIYGVSSIKYVRNITDVDDKIINKAQELGVTINDLTIQITKEFHENMGYLGCLSPTIQPKATEHINEMIMIIQQLLSLNHAYIADNHVYFDVASYKDYMTLSNRSFDEMMEGVRVDNNLEKKHPQDFVLWKPAKANEFLCSFESPWGKGRPGWHIECSAMSYKYLDKNFDIHGGGSDLIFPHHTNEIAQSRCAFPDSKFAKYWVHNGFLTSNGEKMSKSLGNFITVQDLITKDIPGDVVRLFLLTSHYRKPLDYNEKALNDAKKIVDYWYRAISNVTVKLVDMPSDFIDALLDDLNTPLAIKIINDYAKLVFIKTDEEEKSFNASCIVACANFIGLMQKASEEWFHSPVDKEYINQLISKRAEAKAAKDWNSADQIRQELLKQGIVLEDTNEETKWRKI